MTVDEIQAAIAALQAEILVAAGQPRRTREGDQEIVLNSIAQLQQLQDHLDRKLQGRQRKGLQLTKLKGPPPI